MLTIIVNVTLICKLQDQYILHTAESQNITLPFACRHGTYCYPTCLSNLLSSHRSKVTHIHKHIFSLVLFPIGCLNFSSDLNKISLFISQRALGLWIIAFDWGSIILIFLNLHNSSHNYQTGMLYSTKFDIFTKRIFFSIFNWFLLDAPRSLNAYYPLLGLRSYLMNFMSLSYLIPFFHLCYQ